MLVDFLEDTATCSQPYIQSTTYSVCTASQAAIFTLLVEPAGRDVDKKYLFFGHLIWKRKKEWISQLIMNCSIQ